MDMSAPSIITMVDDSSFSMLQRVLMCSPAAPQEGALLGICSTEGMGWVAFTLV